MLIKRKKEEKKRVGSHAPRQMSFSVGYCWKIDKTNLHLEGALSLTAITLMALRWTWTHSCPSSGSCSALRTSKLSQQNVSRRSQKLADLQSSRTQIRVGDLHGTCFWYNKAILLVNLKHFFLFFIIHSTLLLIKVSQFFVIIFIICLQKFFFDII